MNILYVDDDQLSLEIVLRALQTRGYNISTVNSTKADDMAVQLKKLLAYGPVPQMVILDGHNVSRDPTGQAIVDMAPGFLKRWLERNGLPGDTRFVLYSSDEQLVEQIRNDSAAGFSAAVLKGGVGGGLNALLQTIESTGARS
jgi:CheY-like chemotaxis protein